MTAALDLQRTFDARHPVALITGSGSPRVGRVIAERFASRGCDIALHSRNDDDELHHAREALIETSGRRIESIAGDLADEEVADNLPDRAHAIFGRLDIVVTSAAIWHPTPLGEITADEIRRYFDVNALSTFLIARSAGRIMASQPCGGAVVTISDWAVDRPYADHAAYFPSKAAVEMMTRSLAVELAQQNAAIRVNCVRPGPVLLTDAVPDADRRRLAEASLSGRVGTPEAVAHAVEFLAANDFVTGVCLNVDGGRSIYAPDGLQVGLNTG